MYIVRHAETEWNLKKIIMGHKDSPLTAKGIIQAKILKDKFKAINFTAVFSSDSGRAKATANLIVLEKDLAVKTTKLLREKNFGQFEGRLMKDYIVALQEALGKKEKLSWEEIFNNKVGQGDESEGEAITRFIVHLREIASAYLDKNVLVVTHGGLMGMFLMHLGFGTREELIGAVDNTAYLKILSDGVDFFLQSAFGINKKKLLQ